MTLRDFADAIRPELQAMPAPLPRHALLERIIADRTSGARAILPSVPPPARPKLARYAVAIALAAALLVLVVRPGGRRDRDAQPPGSVEFVSSSAFLGSVAFAEAGPVLPRPALPPAQGTHPERLHPMQLEYSRRMTDSAGKETSNLGLSLALSADSLGDVPAWRVVSAQRVMVGDQLRLELDTVYVARDDLRLLARIAHVRPYSRYSDIRVGQVFRGDTVTGGMRATASGRPDARRPISRVLPSPFRPYITNGFAPVYLAAVQLAPGWSRSLSVVGWAVRDEDVSVPIELRVVGEERLQVPAGRFDCWKLSLKSGHRRLWYWVRKSDGIGVRTLDDSEMARRGLREIVLVHE